MGKHIQKLIKYFYLNVFTITSILMGMETKKKIMFPEKINLIVEGTKDIIGSIKKEKDRISFDYDNDKFLIENDRTFIFTNFKIKHIYKNLLKIKKEIPQDLTALIISFAKPIYPIYFNNDDEISIVEESNKTQKIDMKKLSYIDITLENLDSLEPSKANCLLPTDYIEAIELFDEEDEEVSYFYPQIVINIIFDEKGNKSSQLTMYSAAMRLKEVQKYYTK